MSDDQMKAANDMLFSSDSQSFQWGDSPGSIVRGTIEAAEQRQQTDLDSGELLTWPDGRKRMQLVITLQTAEKANDGDDGKRMIYAKGGRYEVAEGEGQSMLDAIREAVKDAGATSIEPGDELAVGFTGLGKKKNRGFNAPKLYSASFKKATKSVSASDLFGDGNETAGDPF